jgi:hypothetical protein
LSHAYNKANSDTLDRISWTHQPIYDVAAVDFVRKIFALEGRDALFVLPDFELAVTLPIAARVLAIHLNWQTKRDIKRSRFPGRVPGHILVLLPNTIGDDKSGEINMSKGPALLSVFTGYAPDNWKTKTFTNITIFFQ